MKSFSLLKTNVGITTNVKVIISSQDNLYLESIDSSVELSSIKYKKFRFNKENFYDELVPYFFKNLPSDIAFNVKYDNDNGSMSTDFNDQFDDIYNAGCRNISNNKGYGEEFECFAPLYVSGNDLPENFIIFRVDGPGLVKLDKNNFHSEIINNLKCIKVFDLTESTNSGEWLNRNFANNKSFPRAPFEMDYRQLEFSRWYGVDYETGGYTYKSVFMDSILNEENTFFDFEKKIYDGYKNNKIIFPNIINMNFLFDDTPATPDVLRKWSINRYFGFYVNSMDHEISISPFIPSILKNDLVIDSNNIIKSQSSTSIYSDQNIVDSYIEIEGVFYKVISTKSESQSQLQKVQITNKVSNEFYSTSVISGYKIISNTSLTGKENKINKNIITIDSNNYIKNIDGSNFVIQNFDQADVWVISIDSKYHILRSDQSGIYIQSDYAFKIYSDRYDYWINSSDESFKTSVQFDPETPPIFKIFKLNFTEIKDFDTSIIDTKYSRFEYEVKNELSNSDETKMYTTDYTSTSIPKHLNDYKINNEPVHIPASSEYIANGEAFKIDGNDLTPLWRKNPIRLKWAFQNSISSNDYPYLLNNSFIGEDFNRTTNVYDQNPSIIERNLDYFYTINPSTSSYNYHTLHVESSSEFDFSKYMGMSYSQNYFRYFFGKKSYFENGTICFNTHKWSTFNSGDNVIPNESLFRGIKFRIYDIENIIKIDNQVKNLNVKSNNYYNNYDLSILLSKNSVKLINGELSNATNNLTWRVIDTWKQTKSYSTGSIVNYYDILYISSTNSTINEINENPSNNNDWSVLGTNTIFWVPNKVYSNDDIIYNSGEYYKYASNNGITFWNPGIDYTIGSIVLYNNSTWKSMTQSNYTNPESTLIWYNSFNIGNNYWTKVLSDSDWNIVQLWDSKIVYDRSIFNSVVYNNVVYRTIITGFGYTTLGQSPDKSTNEWERYYSMDSDTNYIYGSTKELNNILHQNNRYYLCISNSNSTLDNGISIYINKVHKNVLINIYINDNTYDNLSNVDRDSLYNDLYAKITASNFISAINDLSNKYEFSDYVNYIIISEDGTINSYNYENITELPTIITCHEPDEFYTRIDSLVFSPIGLKTLEFKSKRKLDNGKISTSDMINYYNGNDVGVSITKNENPISTVDAYHGLKNVNYNNLYRHSGYYMPIFNEISLFERGSVTSSTLGKNYKFDVELSDFGISTEVIISKVNRYSNILKLKDINNVKSIYPMLDEFGYTYADIFIFKSTWDLEFYIECSDVSLINNTIMNSALYVSDKKNNDLF